MFLLMCISNIANAHTLYTFDELSKLSSDALYASEVWKNLLHYDGNKSVINKDSNFFLSENGYKNPKEEYFATLKAFIDEPKTICKYPARFSYIINSLKLNDKKFKNIKCDEYEEYMAEVPIDNVYIVFAAENNLSPSSMMGHSFLKLSGKDGESLKEHSFSYFAAFDNINSLKFYWDVVTTGLDGAYILSPYREKSAEYLYGEKRSLWEFRLDLSKEDIERLKKHLWELRGSNIRYSLISHNCNTAVVSILKTANPKFNTENIKPFETPLEYIQKLFAKGVIKDIEIDPTDYVRQKISKNGIKNLLDANKSSRLEIQHSFGSGDVSLVKFSPVYQDIRDVNNAYFDEMESKIGEISLGYSYDNNRVFVKDINILKMRSILDYGIQQDYSKHFKLSLENNIDEEKTNLKPTVEFGLGYGTSFDNIQAYVIPKFGYRYNKYSNVYFSPEVGFIARIGENYKIMSSYEIYFNSKDNNRGYNQKYNLYAGYKLFENMDTYIEYSHYEDSNYKDVISMGVSYKF